ncbi:MAG: chloride channel protein [Gammaproteobacteria bacterium]|nr:MAG: chloride channel protein [Gammaproteobacteria bacterium]
MSILGRWNHWRHDRMDEVRLHLSKPDALLQQAVLGCISGLIAGGVIILFRFIVEGTQDSILPGEGPENYEALHGLWRFVLPISGSLLLAVIFWRFSKGIQVLGVARVLERLAYHQGRLTTREFLLQFFGAAIAIISGHSVGREGPHVHLGAASGSLLGQKLGLPNNSIRILAGCGVAAGIAASFNTPLAGVVFALEVVMMEYTVISFTPIILAAVSATVLSNVVLGGEPAFSVPPLALGSLKELPVVLALGFFGGVVSAGFIHLLKTVAERSKGLQIWWRIILAGGIVGLLAWQIPEIMGIGYDSIDRALLGQFGAGILVILLVVKIVATSASVGLGIPGGMIGPALFIGAIFGSLVGISAEYLYPESESLIGFYALLGMGAVMGASLQAPLAALVAMLELTHNPGIILPGMLAVVIAGLTASELFHKESLFVTMLKASGLDYNHNPMVQLLRRAGVASLMNTNFDKVDERISPDHAERLLNEGIEWLLIRDEEKPVYLLPAVDLAKYIRSFDSGSEEHIDLLEIPARRYQIAAVHLQATLQEAYEIFDEGTAEALYIERMTVPGIWRTYGVLTKEMVDSAYRY